jgi:hypothetical protein
VKSAKSQRTENKEYFYAHEEMAAEAFEEKVQG